MRVLLVSSSSGSRGGGELYLLGLSRELIDAGLDVTVMLSNDVGIDELAEQFDSRAKVVRVPYTNTYRRRLRSLGSAVDTRVIRELATRFRCLAPDVIHLNQQNLEDGLDLVKAAENTRIPYVSTIHITRPMTELGARFGKARDLLARRVLRSTSGAMITISHACRRQLQEFLGSDIAQTRLLCVPNGVPDIESESHVDHRPEWGFAEGDFVLGCVARIEDQKNPMFAVELLSRLPERVKLVWVGDGSLRTEFERLATCLGVIDRIRVDGWRRDARSRLRSCDVFVLPSLYEGLPLALLEAMACGMPIIASSVDGMADVIEHGQNGMLAGVNDTETWMGHVRCLMDSHQLRVSLGDAARKSFVGRYSASAAAEATIVTYQQQMERAAVACSPTASTTATP